MIELESNFYLVLLVCNAVLLALAIFSIARFERRCRRFESFWNSPTGVAVADDSSAEEVAGVYLQATTRLEQRLGELQRTVKVMELNAPVVSPAEERSMPIDNAIRMAQQGASVSDLTKACGLNVGEAHLMRKLHGQPIQPGAVNA